MVFLILLQSREQQLIHAHTLRLRISLDLLTLSLRNIDTDIIVMPFEVLRVRSGLFPLFACGTLLAILLRAGGHGVGLTADRTNLFAAYLYGTAGLLLLSIRTVTGSLSLITAIDTVFGTGVVRLKLQSAHLTFMLKQRLSPLNIGLYTYSIKCWVQSQV